MDRLRAHWLWLVGPRTWMMSTSLSPANCAARLRPMVGSWWWPLGDAAVIGWVSEREARFKRRLLFWRNDFRSEMHVLFLPEGAGSRLVCRNGLGRDVRIFATIWGLSLTVIILVILGVIIASNDRRTPLWAMAATPLGMLGFLYLVVLLGRALSLGDDTFLLTFIAGRLEASPAEESVR
jgi:hypothetical protein